MISKLPVLKKILILGSDYYSTSIEIFYTNQIKKYYTCEFFNSKSQFIYYLSKNYTNKIFFKLGLSSIYKIINQNILTKINSFKPDLIWVFKGTEIYPETLQKIKDKGIILINYNGDSPFNEKNKGSFNKNIKYSFKFYDYYFSFNKAYCKRLQQEKQLQSKWLPFASNNFYKKTGEIDNIKAIKKIAFIGNPDKKRIKYIEFLEENKIPMDVFGNNWKKHFKPNRYVSFKAPITGENFKDVFSTYKLQLNLLRDQNYNSHNMRTVEIPSFGGVQISEYSEEQKEMYEENTNIFLYKNKNEMISMIKKMLNKSDKELNFIRKKSITKSKESHTYEHRVEKIILPVFNSFLK